MTTAGSTAGRDGQGATTPAGRSLSARGARWLIENGLVTPAVLHRHGLIGRDTSQSNAVAVIEIGDGTGFAVKDTRPHHDIAQGSPAQELHLYRFLRDRPGLPRVAPELVDADPVEQLLVVEALVRHRRMDDIGVRRDLFDPAIATAIGAALGGWHRATHGLVSSFDEAVPWMLHIDGALRLAVLDQQPFADVMATVLDDPALATVPGRCRASWRTDAVIHGDVRFANLLVATSPVEVRLVDWETSGAGDRRWDIAGVLQEYVTRDAPAGSEAEVEVDERTLQATDACCAAYAAAWGATDAPSDLAPFVAARVLMRAFQVAAWGRGETTDGEVERHLDVARRVLAAEGAR